MVKNIDLRLCLGIIYQIKNLQTNFTLKNKGKGAGRRFNASTLKILRNSNGHLIPIFLSNFNSLTVTITLTDFRHRIWIEGAETPQFKAFKR